MRLSREWIVWRFLSLVALIAPFINTRAQICNGSLGDPAVNITFGKAGTGGPSNYVPTSSYFYQTADCPNDGYYTVASHTANCFGNTWHMLNDDHTGGGNFMLVNASFSPGDFFLTTVTDLCPNTTYEFAAWVMNVMKVLVSIPPNLTFKIETPSGGVLGLFNTGSIPVTTDPEWKQFGFFFTTPSTNSTIVLRITNNAAGGYGNDLALDDITFRPCGAKITAEIDGNNNLVDICEGNTSSYTFNSTVSSAYTSPVYRWQSSIDSGATWVDIPGATSPSYQRPPSGPGSYFYRLTITDASVAGIPSCRIASNALVINVHPKPVVDAGPDRVYIAGYPVTLNGIVTGERPVFNWTPTLYMDSASELNPIVTPPVDMTYILSATSAYGCSNQDKVNVKSVSGIFVPNAFTPNGDGKNDTWNIPYIDPSFRAEVNVFNRWGQLVYHSDGLTISWDGSLNGVPQASGTYVYSVVFKTGFFPNMKGTITLIR